MDFYKGMDISFLPQCMDEGMKIKDFDGTVIDPFELMTKYGVNAVRLRIWHTPENIPWSKGYCNLEHTIAMAKQIKAHGMMLMLDFHYSDFWADPANQRKPAAWEKFSYEELKEAVYQYTRDTLKTMQNEGVLPDVVQIGNEIRSGLLFPDGELPDYAGMVGLVNAGIAGARSVADSSVMRVMIHLDQGGRYFYLKEWFSKAFAQGLADFDLIGLSYYPFWHGSYTDLKETMERLVTDYGKPIMIVETAYAWRKCEKGFIDEAQEKIAGFEATPQGQRKVLDLVNHIVAALPDGMGQGVFYWEPLCQPWAGGGGWAENMGLLDQDGAVLESIRSFEFAREDATPQEWAKIYELPTVVTVTGSMPRLPEEVSVLKYDGSLIKKKVRWEAEPSMFENPGVVTAQGIVEKDSHGAEKAVPETKETKVTQGASERVRVSVTVEVKSAKAVSTAGEEANASENLLRDVNWDEGFANWNVEKSEEQVLCQLYPEFIDPYPAPPLNSVRVEENKNFSFRISQQVPVTPGQCYCLTADLQGTDTTGVDVRLFAVSGEQKWETYLHLTEHGFETCELKDIRPQEGSVTVGLKVKASPMYLMVRKFGLYEPKRNEAKKTGKK